MVAHEIRRRERRPAADLYRHGDFTTSPIPRIGYCRIVVVGVASKVEKFGRAPLYTRSNQKIGSSVAGFGSLPFSNLASFLFLVFFLLFFGSRRQGSLSLYLSPSSLLLSLFLPFIASLLFFFLLFRSRTVRPAYSRCDVRRGRMGPRARERERKCVCVRACVCICMHTCVRACARPVSGEVVQWGHMSKQLAHRCIEFTEEPMEDVHDERIVQLRHGAPARYQ